MKKIEFTLQLLGLITILLLYIGFNTRQEADKRIKEEDIENTETYREQYTPSIAVYPITALTMDRLGSKTKKKAATLVQKAKLQTWNQ